MKNEAPISNIVELKRGTKLVGDDKLVASIEEISPQVATNWLRCNRLNRPVRRKHVAFLSREMTEGLWQLNGQAIIISEDENVLDGQHRLLAIIDSGVTIKSLVVYGVNKEAFKTIDTGAVRVGSDALSVWFPGRPITIVKAVAGAVSWCSALERGFMNQKDKLANSETISYVNLHPTLWKVAERLTGFAKANRPLSLSLGTALWEMFARKSPNAASEFMLDLYGGETVTDTAKAAFVLRGLLEKDQKRVSHYTARVKARMTIKAWNLHRAGRDEVAAPSLIAVNTRDSDRIVIR